MNNMSCISKVVQELFENNTPYHDIAFVANAESFAITAQNVVNFFVEANVNRDYITI